MFLFPVTKSVIAAFFFTTLFWPIQSMAEILAECGESNGKAVRTTHGSKVWDKTSTDAGATFYEDGFRGSNIYLETIETSDGKTEFDVIFKSPNGGVFRDSENGSVMLLNYNSELSTFLILSRSKLGVLTYLFNLNRNGTREVLWTESLLGSLPRIRVMIAKCK